MVLIGHLTQIHLEEVLDLLEEQEVQVHQEAAEEDK
jgi:hypothetical protein